MASFDAGRPLGTISKIVAFVALLASFSALAQIPEASPSDVCAQSILAGTESSPRSMDRSVESALNRARRAINADELTDARAFVAQLELGRLTPYELAMAEGVLFRISNAERKYEEARQHLVRAIESCGLTDKGIADAQRAIKRIDARFATLAVDACATVARPDPLAPAEAALQELVAQIDEIRLLRGSNSPGLLEPLDALSLFYEERGDYEIALALIEEIIQVIEINYGLHTLDEAQLLRRRIRIERARGNAEAAWNEEQDLLGLIRRQPYDARIVPMLQEVACGRRAILTRYKAGEFPPEIVLGCYYSRGGLQSQGGRTGCRSGNRRAVIRGLGADIASYEGQARLLAGWAESPCVSPDPQVIGGEPSKRHTEEVRAFDHLLAVVGYTRCVDAKYRLAASANAPPGELLRRVSDRNAAVEELASQAAIYEERFGHVPKLVDAVVAWLREP